MKDLTECNCGYGIGWYHCDTDSKHEFNPDVTPEQAKASLWEERLPPGSFYHHIDDYVLAEIITYTKGPDPYDPSQIKVSSHRINKKRFSYKKFGWKGACVAAAKWVESNLKQKELFPGF